MDTGLDQNQTELAVNVLAVALQMLSDGDGLLDQVVEILGQIGLQTDGLHDAQDLVAADETHLGDSMGITKDAACVERGREYDRDSILLFAVWSLLMFCFGRRRFRSNQPNITSNTQFTVEETGGESLTDLGWGHALLAQLHDLLLDIFGV